MCVPGGAAIRKKVFTSQIGLRSTGGLDLLKWGLPGGGVKSAKVAPTPYVYRTPGCPNANGNAARALSKNSNAQNNT